MVEGEGPFLVFLLVFVRFCGGWGVGVGVGGGGGGAIDGGQQPIQ